MPEYLAPGVYVEEVPSGNKPIEGVSTSTVGMVGVTQRGPVNEPTLITSFPEFLRVYGGYLSHLEFTNHRDKLPYAVEGFFNNGGQRVYVSRIVGENATFGVVDLFGTPLADAVDTALASRAAAGGDTLVVTSGENIEAGTMLLLVDGPRSEYVTAEGGGTEAGATVAGTLHFDHASGDPVAIQDVTESAQLETTGDMSAGDAELSLVDASGLSAGDVVRIHDEADARLVEFVTITNDTSAAFDEPGLLFDHALDTTVITVVTLADAAGEPGGRAVSEDVASGSATVLLTSTDDLDGAIIRIGTGDSREFHAVGGIVSTVFLATSPLGVRLMGRLHFDHEGEPIAIQQVTEGDDLTAGIGGDMTAGGAPQIADASGLSAGDTLRLRDTSSPARTEFVTIATDGAADITEQGLLFDHPQASTELHRVTLAPAAGGPGGRMVQGEASQGGGSVPLNQVADLQADDVISVGEGSTREYQIVRSIVDVPPGATTAMANIHAAGTRVVSQVALLRVHARYPGRWGNDLRVRIRRTSVLETQVAGGANAGDSPIRLGATFGLSAGSVLEIASGGTTFRQRVAGVSTTTNEVELADGVAINIQPGDLAWSVEFDLIVERLEGGKVVESETIGDLGLDPGHNRYAIATVGRFDTGTGRAERAGESELVRLSDLTTGAAERLLSLPFENPISATELASLYTMMGGNDDLASIDDEEYIGTPAVDPDDRSGIQSLENIDDISIVAVPGQSSQDVQNAIIAHCTRMRYRFGILDSGDRSKLRDVQEQRQNYDTTYGALYYPWMHIGDPFGQNGDILSIPPSGHVAGVYARSDNQRGVHKAPANEALLGIRELKYRLTKGEQDILNPRHINCLRDFREMNRGLRIWGARTLSSDPEFKYINVRRLFLFIEKSIERGSQYAVFEPNSEALWATINRSVTNFLTAVWRDGALEGTKPEEAFFVKVDRSTMTQNDIDNGRLIILIGIAPVKPAEFVIFRISQKTREAVA